MARFKIALGNPITSSMAFDEASNSLWYIDAAGDFHALRVLGQRITKLGSGWPGSVAALPASDGASAIIVLQSGVIMRTRRNNADFSSAVQLSDIGNPVVTAALLPDGDLLVLDEAGSLQRVSQEDGAISAFSAAIMGAVALCVHASQSLAFIGVKKTDGTYLLEALALADGSVAKAPQPLVGTVSSFGTSSGGDRLLIVDDTGAVTLRHADGTIDPFAFPANGVTQICNWHSLTFAATVGELHAVEWGEEPVLLPIDAGFDPLVPGGWTSMTVDYGAAGLTVADVEWKVRQGPDAASVSVAIPFGASADQYEHRILAGKSRMEIEVEAIDKLTSTLLATRKFRIIDLWPDDNVGPPIAITGKQEVRSALGSWGGGPVGPQNIDIHPAPEEFRVIVAMLRTKGGKTSVNPGDKVAFYKDAMTAAASVKRYYEEVSFRNTPGGPPLGTTVTLVGNQVFGPIDLEYTWRELFNPDKPKEPFSAWYPRNERVWNYLGGPLSNFLLDADPSGTLVRTAHAVVFVMLPGSDAPTGSGDDLVPAQWVWPRANLTTLFYKPNDTSTTFRQYFPGVVMPAARPAQNPSYTNIVFTDDIMRFALCHELGHSLGCADQYMDDSHPAEIRERSIGDFDLMANGPILPHFALAHRMRLGWINPSWIEAVDFGKDTRSRTITLQSTESLQRVGPLPGAKAGVEIRIRDGWNYYFECRRKQPGQFGDQLLSSGTRVIGSDVRLQDAAELVRPLILKLPVDSGGAGPELWLDGQNYEESDTTNPERMHDFILTRGPDHPTNPDLQTVKIDYIRAHRVELQISPAPGGKNFKSPDIDLDSPAGRNKVAKGVKNTISVRVRNAGTRAADKVQIHIKWLPFTTAPGAWNPLPDPPPIAIGPAGIGTFTIDWIPPANLKVNNVEVEHFCIRVDIDRYVDPLDPSGEEIVVFNNWVQSNFTTSAVGSGSPSDRRQTPLIATNVLKRSAVHHTVIEQTHALFRAYVDHSWRRLGPNETDVTVLSYESLAGDPISGGDYAKALRETHEGSISNDLRARTFISPDADLDSHLECWGAQLLVTAGLRTWIEGFTARGELASGKVTAENEGVLVAVNNGIMRLAVWPMKQPEMQMTVDGNVQPDGSFRILLPMEVLQLLDRDRLIVQAYYHGAGRFAPCKSRRVSVWIN